MAGAKLDGQTLGQVFEGRPDILAGIQKAADTPARITLFNNIANFVAERLGQNSDEPASKRRRVDIVSSSSSKQQANGSPQANGSSSLAGAETEQVLLEVKDISVAAPVRKKYDLCFTKNFFYARASGTTAPVQGVVYPWREIEHAFYLPVPEKAQIQHNYVFLPRASYLPPSKNASEQQASQQTTLEPLVFMVPATAPKPGSISGTLAPKAEAFSDSYNTLLNWITSNHLPPSVKIISSDPKVFHSLARQPYRPNEKGVHVKAFRGSKDGYLFFLPTGILWGFKKPILFLPLNRIVALSYTSVLQRTFNVVVEFETLQGEADEIEFGMLDQEDYGMIDANYVKRHGLADRSLAEGRKAKRELAENHKKGDAAADGVTDGAGGGDGGGDDEGLTELEKAQREAEQRLQDDEDEDEEDYDPGSEGESEGSGSSDSEEEEEDEDEDGEGEDEDEEDEDLEMEAGGGAEDDGAL